MKIEIKSALKAGFMAVIAAATINSILFFVFQSLGIIVDTIEPQPGQPLSVIHIILSSTIPSIIGAMVFYLFDKYSSKGLRNFQILAIILLVVTFVNPFMGIPNVTTGYALALNVMHVVVAFSLLYFIRKEKAKTVDLA